MSLLETFITEITKYLTRCGDKSAEKLISFYDTQGEFDFSFPNSLEIWKNYLTQLTDDNVKKYLNNIINYGSDTCEDDNQALEDKLKLASSTWTFQLDKISTKDGRCSFTVNRSTSFRTVMNELNTNSSYGMKTDKDEDETISLEVANSDDKSSISQYRLELITAVIKNLVAYSRYILVNDSNIAKHKMLITTKSNSSKNEDLENKKLVVCGVVLSPSDKKISKVNADEYVKMRCEDMHLISIHKYGVRIKDNEAFKSLVEKLGRSAATLDLLEVKHSSAVTLKGDPKQAFVLYQSCRIETLMEKFDSKVSEGYYKPLPDVDDIDWSLLKENEEWYLLKLILAFPAVIDRSINELSDGKVALHLIHGFISNFVKTFSIYYRRVRLLTENRPQLMNALYTKIHFLKSIQRIFNETLALLCIEPVAFM